MLHDRPSTLRQAVAAATAALAANSHLTETASRDAESLLLHILKISRATLLAHPEDRLTQEQSQDYQAAIARRLALEPIQYITGQQDFYGLTFRVTPAVLIPRPETELLVETALEILPHNRLLRIADVGSGSGAIAIAIAHHLPQAQVTALDISPEALAVARHNAETHHVASRIRFLHSDLLTAVHGEQFDAILSNPPYVPEIDRPTLHPQVRDHEPPTALFAGPSGLDIYTRLIPQAAAVLPPGTPLLLELSFNQKSALAELLKSWHNVSFRNDLQQIPRIALAYR